MLANYVLETPFEQENKVQDVFAWDKTLHRFVVIKRIPVKNSEELEYLLQQARKLAALSCSVFAKVHAIEEEPDCFYIVFEKIIGETIRVWTTVNPVGEKFSLIVAGQVAEALKEMHELGLVYGQLQSDDLLVDQTGKLRLLHFGIVFDNLAHTQDDKSIPATLAYWAPERFDQKRPQAPGDVFALGTIVYELLVGELPYPQFSGMQLIAAQVQNNSQLWKWPESIPEILQELVRAMTRREIANRLSAEQVVEKCKVFWERESYANSLSGASLISLTPQTSMRNWDLLRHRGIRLVILMVLCCGMAAYYAKPNWAQIATALKPFSVSRELVQGIDDLKEYTYNSSLQKLESAGAHFETILARQPENAEAVGYMSYVMLARYGSSKRDEIWMQRAIASTQQALRLNPDLAITQVANAKILHWQHKFELAMKANRRALALDPDCLFAWQSTMSTLLESGQHAEALSFADEGSKRFPKDRFLLDLKAGIYMTQNENVKAEQTSRISLERQPDSSLAYAMLARALEEQNRSEESLQVIQKGLQVRPNANLYEELGQAKLARGDYAAAAVAFANAASPQKGIAGSYARWLNLGEALMWLPGRENEGLVAYQKARDLLEIRLKRSPDDEVLLAPMSLIEARLGHVSQAKSFAEQVISLAPEKFDLLFEVALTYELIGYRGQALQLLSKAKSLGLPNRKVVAHPIFKDLIKDRRYQ